MLYKGIYNFPVCIICFLLIRSDINRGGLTSIGMTETLCYDLHRYAKFIG